MSERLAAHDRTGEERQHLDGLVARYAVLGAERRRKQRRRRLGRGFVATGVIGAAVAASLVDVDVPGLMPGLEELRVLRSTLTTELEAFDAGRAELAEQRALLERQSTELALRLGEYDRRAAALEAESSNLREQTARLEAALARVDEERQALLAAAPSRQASPQEVESIEERQRGLEQQREEFVAQQSEVSGELDLLSVRRSELEERRLELEAQRRELEALLDAAGRGAPSSSPAMASSPGGESISTAGAPSEPLRERGSDPAAERASAASPADLAIASTVEPSALGDIRGGVRLGDGMNVSIGLTRSATINGIEQVTNTLTLDGLNRTLGALPAEGLDAIVIQNGPGNSLESPFLSGVPTSFGGTIIQNTLDDQVIDTSTILDVSITDVSKVMDGVAAGQALRDSLYFQQ